MSWNYRIVHKYGMHDGAPWDELGVHEVHYEGNKPVSMTKDDVSPSGEGPKEFTESWKLYQKAFQKPALFYDCDNECFTSLETWEVFSKRHIDQDRSRLPACDNEYMENHPSVLVPLDSFAWLAQQVSDACEQSRSMLPLLRQYSDELDAERVKNAKLYVQLEETEKAANNLRRKIIELNGRLERLRKGLPEFEDGYVPDPNRKTTGQLIDPGEPGVRIV